MNRKVWTSLLIIGMALAAIAGGTLAWFTDQASTGDNIFTAGTLEIEADESWEYEDTGVENWNPGDCTDKEVTVRITGTKRAYLRMQFNDGWYENTGDEEEPNWVPWVPNDPPGVDPIVKKLDGALFPDDIDTWVKLGDWYYYIGIGDPATNETIKVISQVCLDGTSAGNQFQGKQYRLGFQFQAIQVTHEACFEQWGVGYIDYDQGGLVVKGWYPVTQAGATWTLTADGNTFEWVPTGAAEANYTGWQLAP